MPSQLLSYVMLHTGISVIQCNTKWSAFCPNENYRNDQNNEKKINKQTVIAEEEEEEGESERVIFTVLQILWVKKNFEAAAALFPTFTNFRGIAARNR